LHRPTGTISKSFKIRNPQSAICNYNARMHRVYFIIGCTASGKGAFGRELASRVGGQIISVDSMKIYRRMDIGTAKPSPQIRAQIPHWCLDIVDPWEKFSVAQYVRHADQAVSAIRQAAAIPLAVGGTSLYFKALWEGIFEATSPDPQIRRRLLERSAGEGLAALHAELGRADPQAATRIHANDEKRIVRALEVYQATGKPISQLQRQWGADAGRYDCVFLGLRRDKADLSHRINLRVKRMIYAGLRDEVAALLADPRGISDQAAQAVGYAEMFRHLNGELTLDEAIEQIKINTRRLAKKQRTWQRRFPNVNWFDLAADTTAAQLADTMLQRIEFK
jgi:tRNA dimethylallyltransferase